MFNNISAIETANQVYSFHKDNGFGLDPFRFSHDLVHTILNLSTSIVDELVVTSLEMEKLLSYEECEELNNQNNIDYSLNNEWSVELYQQVVEKYNSLPVKSILEIECMSDIKWWNEFSRELEVLHLSEDEDYLF